VLTDVWPLFGLVLRTPRLELRVPSLEQLAALGELAGQGVHDPDRMPFFQPWTDQPPAERARSVLQYQWSSWGKWTPQSWSLELVVLAGGEVVGMQGIGASGFAGTREVHTGSWLGRRYQRLGYGAEMRAAVLHLAFAGLGAEQARSGAFTDNAASLGVSRKLGYVPDGTARHVVRDRLALEQRLLLDRGRWEAHRTVRVEIEGLAPCLPLLGLDPAALSATGPAAAAP
jgi:RimJ/RimL family protein N-acetyltransferase